MLLESTKEWKRLQVWQRRAFRKIKKGKSVVERVEPGNTPELVLTSSNDE